MQARNRSVLIVAVASAFAISACGSAVPPNEFVGAQGVVNPYAPQSSVGVAGPSGAVGGGPAPAAQGGTGGALGGTGAGGGTGGGSGGTGGSGSGSGGSHGSGSGSGSGSGGSGGTGGGPALGVRPGSCSGFKNTTGISDSSITIANASDISGPLPGLFKSARQAVQAFAAYFNSLSSICGRKLSVETLDSGTSDLGDQQASLSACSDAFALVGSMSGFDSGGSQTVQSCGIPEIRAITVNPARAESKVTYAADALTITQIPSAPFEYFKKASNGAYKHAGLVYLNAGAVIPNARSFKAAEERMGYHFDYTTAFDVTTLNYDSIARSLESAGVKYVQFEGAWQYAVKLKSAMDVQGYKPFFAMDSVAYDPGFVELGGKAVDGTYAFLDSAMFEEAARNPEMQTYLAWLARISPGAAPSFFGEFAWGAARLFTEIALRLGGRLTRQNVLAALSQVKNYTSNGLFSPQSVGARLTSPCQSVIQLVNGKWVRRGAYPYICGTLVSGS